MRRLFPLPALLTAFFLFCFSFVSCSDLDDDYGSITISFDGSELQSSSRNVVITENEIYNLLHGTIMNGQDFQVLGWIVVCIRGDYNEDRNIPITQQYGSYSVTFNSLPTNNNIWVEANVYAVDGSMFNHIFIGQSSLFNIEAGENSVNINMKDMTAHTSNWHYQEIDNLQIQIGSSGLNTEISDKVYLISNGKYFIGEKNDNNSQWSSTTSFSEGTWRADSYDSYGLPADGVNNNIYLTEYVYIGNFNSLSEEDLSNGDWRSGNMLFTFVTSPVEKISQISDFSFTSGNGLTFFQQH